MFKKIQNYLLLHHPLLWNTRVVPVLAISLIIHIIFFICGYSYGEVDFSENNGYSYNNGEEVALFMGVTLTILLTIIWLVFYLRNNSFKTFYPKNNYSLFKEWLILVFILTINSAFAGSFFFGSDVRKRNYYSEEELLRRVELLKMASVFTDGPFEEDDTEEKWDGENFITVKRDSFEYDKRKYSLRSLMNRAVLGVGATSVALRDSVAELKIKRMMAANKKDSVQWVFNEFFKMAKEHGATANITPTQWLAMAYDYPEFTKYIKIGTQNDNHIDLEEYQTGDTYGDMYHEDEYANLEETSVTIDSTTAAVEVAGAAYNGDGTKDERDTIPLDTLSFRKIITEKDTFIVHKYYVPHTQMVIAYADIAEGYYSPNMPIDATIVFLYLGTAMSLVLFSFRVTSGRSWLIAAVAFGILALLTSILNIIIGYLFISEMAYYRYSGERFFAFWIVLVLVLLIYFYRAKRSKNVSAVILNIVIWLAPAILPITGIILDEYYNMTVEHNDNGARITPMRFMEEYLDNNMLQFFFICLLVNILFMYFLTQRIKKWKGLPEA